MKIFPLTIGMTPAFYDQDNILLRTQLNCLSKQTVKDFDVWLIDPHYAKRKDIIPELSERYKLNIVHVPYAPNIYISKLLDCSIFNAVYCYSRAPRIVRYSCYRFVRPDFVDRILSSQENVNLEFYSLNVGQCLDEERRRKNGEDIEYSKHKIVWNFESDEVNWNKIPDGPGVDNHGQYTGDENNSLARWGTEAMVDTDIISTPLNCYGNIMWWRHLWFDINGTNEVFTNFEHWEDCDFCVRAKIADHKVKRLSKLMYRLYHTYGKYSQRSNVEVDVPLRPMCDKCKKFRIDVSCTGEKRKIEFKKRIELEEIQIFYDEQIWMCKECLLTGPVWFNDPNEYTNNVIRFGLKKATILSDQKIGRNLKILSEDMDRYTNLYDKIDIFNDSWTNRKYYDKC